MYIHCAWILTKWNRWQCHGLFFLFSKKNCNQIWAFKITTDQIKPIYTKTCKYTKHLKHNKQDNAQMYTVVIISLWSLQYIAHSAKILKTGKINTYMKSTLSNLEHVHSWLKMSLTWMAQEQYEDTGSKYNPIKPHTTSNFRIVYHVLYSFQWLTHLLTSKSITKIT